MDTVVDRFVSSKSGSKESRGPVLQTMREPKRGEGREISPEIPANWVLSEPAENPDLENNAMPTRLPITYYSSQNVPLFDLLRRLPFVRPFRETKQAQFNSRSPRTLNSIDAQLMPHDFHAQPITLICLNYASTGRSQHIRIGITGLKARP
jgi:hypothetical protein